MNKIKKIFVFPFLFSFLFIVPFVVVHPSYAGNEHVLDIQEVVSSGGIKAWLVEDKSVPVISMDFAFNGAGSALESKEKQGLVRMLSNTMDEGAGDMESQAFQSALGKNSIDLHFNSSRDAFFGSLKTLKENRDKAFELMSLALTSPRFDSDPVERMRQANLARVRSSASDPDWIAARILNDVAFAGHPYAMNSGGTLSTLKNITSEDLRKFAKIQLGKDRLVIAVAGDITKEELAPLLDKTFGALPEKSAETKIPDLQIKGGGEIVLYDYGIPQTIINIAQKGLSRKDPDYYAFNVMNFILGGSGLGSRLMEEIREKRGLTYGIYTRLYNLDHLNALTLNTSTKNSSAKEVLEMIRKQWKIIQDEQVRDEELQTAKSYITGSLPLSLSSTDRISGMMLSLQMDDLPIDYLDTREKEINSVTLEKVQEVAKKLLVDNSLTIVLVGQPEGIKPTQTIEKLPNVD